MGSSYYGDPNLGNERSGAGSSRKGKKNSSDRPRQPQRGLGVAQLEKIRLHSEMGCSYLHPFHGPSYPTNINQDDMGGQTAYSSVPSSSSFSYTSSSSASNDFRGQQNVMMGMGEIERGNIRYADNYQPSTTPRWNPSNGMLETQHFVQPSMTTQFPHYQVEDSSQRKRKKDRSDSTGARSYNSATSDTQELDLELRLSL